MYIILAIITISQQCGLALLSSRSIPYEAFNLSSLHKLVTHQVEFNPAIMH